MILVEEKLTTNQPSAMVLGRLMKKYSPLKPIQIDFRRRTNYQLTLKVVGSWLFN